MPESNIIHSTLFKTNVDPNNLLGIKWEKWLFPVSRTTDTNEK